MSMTDYNEYEHYSKLEFRKLKAEILFHLTYCNDTCKNIAMVIIYL